MLVSIWMKSDKPTQKSRQIYNYLFISRLQKVEIDNLQKVQMKITQIVFSLLCMLGIYALFIEFRSSYQTKYVASDPFGFYNFTGNNVTQEHVDLFIDLINTASHFYREDTKARLDYISDSLKKRCKIQDCRFQVVQFGIERQFDRYAYHSSSFYASVNPRIDKIFSQYSYMFLFRQTPINNRVFLHKIGQKGSGINSTLEKIIQNIILGVEVDDKCIGFPKQISQYLYKYDGGQWSVFCSSSLAFKLNVYVKDDKYIYIRPRRSYYAIYQVQRIQ